MSVYPKQIYCSTSGELNLLFIGIAKRLDIEAHPALVSTRSHGKMFDQFPFIDQFNHLMAVVKYKGQMQVVDIGNKHRPIGLPRINAFNNQAWMVRLEEPEWFDLPVPKQEVLTMIEAKLSTNGIMEGVIQSRYKGYAAVDAREDIDKSAKTAIVNNSENTDGSTARKLEDRFPDIEISNTAYTGLEQPEAPLNVKYHCRIPETGLVSGDFIYLTPIILPAFDENPCKQEERTYPVDLPYTIDERYIINLEIPDNFEIEELPEDENIILNADGGSFQILTKLVGQYLHLNCSLKLNQIHFEPEEYQTLKTFISLVIDKQREQIVLRKKI